MAKSEYQKKKQQAMSSLAKDCLNRLTDLGYGMREISKMMEGRVSYRTLYRWYNNGPVQRESDVVPLDIYVASHPRAFGRESGGAVRPPGIPS